MMRSLFAAVSGLRNHQLSLSVIGNNIANINTVGFKGGRALFKEMLSETLQGASRPTADSAGTNPLQVGLGMSVASVTSSFSQGQLQLTGNQMDMAVQGDGFFVLQNGARRYYSRAGAFGFDGEGRLTAGQGLLVQGWLANPNGQVGSGSALENITLPFGQTAPAQATSSVRLASNLDAAATALSTITQSNSLRATAQSTDQLQDLFNSSGQSLGFQDGDTIRISFAGTADTLVTNLMTESGAALDLQDGDSINITDGTGSTAITFSSAWTMGDLAGQIQTALNTGIGTETDIAVSVNPDGSLAFSNPAGGNNVDLTVSVSAAGRPVFNSLTASVPVINGTSTARSAGTVVEREITSGTDFNNLNELAVAVQNVMRLGSYTATVAFTNGRFAYDNSSVGAGQNDLIDVRISRPGVSTFFADAMGLNGSDLTAGSTANSDLLLDTADASDELANLYNSQGTSLGLQTGDVFTFGASVGGTPISQATLSVVNTGDGAGTDRSVQTLGGLVSELEDILDLRTTGGVELVDGAVQITGRSGLSGEITDIAFNELNNANLAASLGFTETQAATDVTHEASIRVFDSLGSSQLLSILFTKDNDTDNRWTWELQTEAGQINSGATGSVTFNGDGTLDRFVTDDGQPVRIDPATGANGPLVIDLNAGTRNGVDGLTGFARDSSAAMVGQDGYGMGTLESISVGADGTIQGVFTNGTSRALAQIALASFNNPTGLERDGGEGWMETSNSGDAVIRRPGTASEVGMISSGSLEMSNVDIAQEFTNMIVAQRGFQANARTITTSDEMLQELVNLKR